MSANGKAIKNRIKSVDSTMHMAKAMELVASSKMRRATENMLRSRNYAQAMEDAFSGLDLAECSGSAYVSDREEKRICIVVVAGDRGLAGGYNSNAYKEAQRISRDKLTVYVPIGKRSCDYYKKHGELACEGIGSVEKMNSAECSLLCADLCRRYVREEFDALYIVYTGYENVITQRAVSKRLLPLLIEEKKGGVAAEFEPDALSVLEAVMPEYISGIVYGCAKESYLSELASRRNAMSNAEKNASEMIDSLSLQYNRARQAAITQEITEIVAGSQS